MVQGSSWWYNGAWLRAAWRASSSPILRIDNCISKKMSFLWLGGQHRRLYLRVLNNKATKSGPSYNYSLRLVAEWAEVRTPPMALLQKERCNHWGISFNIASFIFVVLISRTNLSSPISKTCAIFLEISLCGAAGPPLHHHTTSLQYSGISLRTWF